MDPGNELLQVDSRCGPTTWQAGFEKQSFSCSFHAESGRKLLSGRFAAGRQPAGAFRQLLAAGREPSGVFCDHQRPEGLRPAANWPEGLRPAATYL